MKGAAQAEAKQTSSRRAQIALVPADPSRLRGRRRKASNHQLVDPLLALAARGAAGICPGLVVRVRPATAFERATWDVCPDDGLRILIDEDGASPENLALGAALPWAAFISRHQWQDLLSEALESRRRERTSRSARRVSYAATST